MGADQIDSKANDDDDKDSDSDFNSDGDEPALRTLRERRIQ